MLDQLLGARNAQTGRDGQSGLSLDQLLTGPGGLATGAAAGGLAALLLGGAKPKKLAKNALKVGGAALVGGLAYKAWRDWQANKTPVTQSQATPVTPPSDPAFLPEGDDQRRLLARSLMRAMIAAAKADGHVTPVEQERILSQLEVLEINQGDRAFIKEELDSPLDVEAVVRDAATPELAAELYTASLLAIDPNGDAEKAYLALLAARLKLDPDLVAHIHANTENAQTPQAA
ncbi:MAG: tellurite resistance TerB family protein [Pseudomonadota bacterium]